MQGSTPNETERGRKDSELDYRNEDDLRTAYEEAESVKGAARRFSAGYTTVRSYLIEYGIHEPDQRQSYSLAAQLESMSPDEIDRAEEGA